MYAYDVTISIKPLGLFTLVSIDLDLGGLLAAASATSEPQQRPTVANRFVKGMSSAWVKRMMT